MSSDEAQQGDEPTTAPGVGRAAERADRLGRVLVVDDDDGVLRAYRRALLHRGFDVDTAIDASNALARFEGASFDVVLSDVNMPNLSGVELMKAVRARDLDVPVVLMSGSEDATTEAEAMENGALEFLVKPVETPALVRSITRAVRLHHMALAKRGAADLSGSGSIRTTDRIALASRFDSAIRSLWMAFQPIVRATDLAPFGYEALLRSKEWALPSPDAVLEAAQRLGRLRDVGRTTRASAANSFADAPADLHLFVNVHAEDLQDPDLVDGSAPLATFANRVILELTDRAAIAVTGETKHRITELRRLGYRIAIDDLGAGYSGLSSFNLLEPDFVKLDLSLVRGVHLSRTKQRLIRSMTALARDLGIRTIAEGVEVEEERKFLVEFGCDFLQGYLFGRPEIPPW